MCFSIETKTLAAGRKICTPSEKKLLGFCAFMGHYFHIMVKGFEKKLLLANLANVIGAFRPIRL